LLNLPEPVAPDNKEPGSIERQSDLAPSPGHATSVVEIPFASDHQPTTEVAISDHAKPAGKISVRLGRTELFELGPTPYQWTRPPRAVIRALQQNLFKTTYMRLLIVTGHNPSGTGCQWRTLLIVLAVPVLLFINACALRYRLQIYVTNALFLVYLRGSCSLLYRRLDGPPHEVFETAGNQWTVTLKSIASRESARTR